MIYNIQSIIYQLSKDTPLQISKDSQRMQTLSISSNNNSYHLGMKFNEFPIVFDRKL